MPLAVGGLLVATGAVAVALVAIEPVLNRVSWAASLDSETPSEGVVVRQRGRSDCGAAALKMIFNHYGIDGTLEDLEAATRTGPDGTSLLALKHVAKQRGLPSQGLRLSVERLVGVSMPAIAHVHGSHFVVVRSATADRIVVDDPSIGRLRMNADAFNRSWDNVILTFSRPNNTTQDKEA